MSIIGGGEEDITNRINEAMTSLMKLKQSGTQMYVKGSNGQISSNIMVAKHGKTIRRTMLNWIHLVNVSEGSSR